MDAGGEEGGGIGRGLTQLEDVGERLEGALGQGDGGVVERVAHLG